MVDVEWALRGVTGSGSPDWVLLDDNGQLVKNPVQPMSSERALLYRIDESAFLPDPHHFIYRSVKIWMLFYQLVSATFEHSDTPLALKQKLIDPKIPALCMGLPFISHTDLIQFLLFTTPWYLSLII